MRNKEIKEKAIRRLFEALKRRPTLLEQKVISIINKYNLPYDYVGDGKVFIACKVPDFINNNGEKKLIEVAGDYWHTPEEMEQRVKHFAKYGFKTLILWEHEINSLAEEEIAKRIREFDSS